MALIVFILILLAVVCLLLSCVLKCEIVEYAVVTVIAVPHSFSWLIVRGSSSYFLIALVAMAIMTMRKKIKAILITMLFVFVMCQT
jgi:hypothetical protein